MAKKILTSVEKPFRLAGQELRVTVSIGISAFPLDGKDEQTLIKNADIAMYHAKEGGKNNFSFYSEDLSADAMERLTLETAYAWLWNAVNFNFIIKTNTIYAVARSLEPRPYCAGNTPAST